MMACRYKQLSLQFYTVLMKYADDLQAVSVDEALIDVSSRVYTDSADNTLGDDAQESESLGNAQALAEQIRDEIRNVTGCESTLYAMQ